MFEFLTGEKLLLSTFREDSYHRVTNALAAEDIPCRVKVIRPCTTIQSPGTGLAGQDLENGLGASGTEYRIFVKGKFWEEADDIAHRYK